MSWRFHHGRKGSENSLDRGWEPRLRAAGVEGGWRGRRLERTQAGEDAGWRGCRLGTWSGWPVAATVEHMGKP